jgi:hypothetical protein
VNISQLKLRSEKFDDDDDNNNNKKLRLLHKSPQLGYICMST